MELRQLRYFNAVVEAGSFTAAAGELHISQPPLSVAIAKLEAEVGVTLLIRTPRGVEPTSAGRYLLDTSSRVLGEIDDMVSALGRFGTGVAGAITLAAVPQLMWHRIPRLLRDYSTAAPEIEVQLVDPPPWSAIDMVVQRQVDLAAIVVADPRRFVGRHRDSLDIVDWGPIPLVGALPPDLDDAPDPLPLRSFDHELVILPQRVSAVPSLPEAVEAIFRRHNITPASIRTVSTIQAGLPLVEAGVGRAVLPDPDHSSLARFDIVTRRLDPDPPPMRALVLARKGARADAKISRLLDHITSAGTRIPV